MAYRTENIDWVAKIEAWVQREEREVWREPNMVAITLFKKKFPIGEHLGKRGSANPNPAIKVYQIIETLDFYTRNKHRFEFIQSVYHSRCYGYEFYFHAIKAPEIVNKDVEIRNRLKVCRRMITLLHNKITLFEETQNKTLFPNFDGEAYNKFLSKKETYINELKILLNNINKSNKI